MVWLSFWVGFCWDCVGIGLAGCLVWRCVGLLVCECIREFLVARCVAVSEGVERSFGSEWRFVAGYGR